MVKNFLYIKGEHMRISLLKLKKKKPGVKLRLFSIQ
ncbi:hypothetical protein N786_01360 [Bacillus amyloliquefaciens UASWS BA1]|nr:hypothetical protein N786_01360 [Bacillus amyloliquefaciens UASWS BA1]